MPVWTLLVSVVRSREAERRSLLGGYFYIKRMLKSIGAFVFVRSREVVRFWEGPLREAPLYAGRATSRAIMEQMSTVLQAPEGINPDAKFLTAGEILERIQSGIPQQKLHQIFVRTGKGIYLVYLDTTTQHLVYDPPVGTGPDAAANYSTIFVLTPSPQGGAVVFRNYVTSGYAPRLTQTRAQPYAYRIRMEVPYPGAQELKPVYTTFSIQDVSQRQGLVTISVPGQDIY